ncbi:TetR/AcrR family transcriptional regulator C-terminal domain-containing protein [Nonomuraea jabiensis]|uniref:TetR/AcrR family transcriptional regulator C-terminal domain-containing protein n=1 Tax=Nonomuraea jabiensis TaxID=882448 RepID=UPI003D75AAF9
MLGWYGRAGPGGVGGRDAQGAGQVGDDGGGPVGAERGTGLRFVPCVRVRRSRGSKHTDRPYGRSEKRQAITGPPAACSAATATPGPAWTRSPPRRRRPTSRRRSSRRGSPPDRRPATCASPRTCARWPSSGLLRIDDADLAAAHLTLLTITDVNQQTFYGAVPLPQEEVDRLVTAGVRAFLRSYAPSSA